MVSCALSRNGRSTRRGWQLTMGKREAVQGQGSLFTDGDAPARRSQRSRPSSAWQMPEVQGSTVAEMRVRWIRRLTPAQVARVERELLRLPLMLSKLGFGPVEVERSFVRRRKS